MSVTGNHGPRGEFAESVCLCGVRVLGDGPEKLKVDLPGHID